MQQNDADVLKDLPFGKLIHIEEPERPQGDLNNAIMTIKAVCEEHNTCVECPMNRNCNEHPAKWEEGAR